MSKDEKNDIVSEKEAEYEKRSEVRIGRNASTALYKSGGGGVSREPTQRTLFVPKENPTKGKKLQAYQQKIGTFNFDVEAVNSHEDAAHVLSPLARQAQETVAALVLDKNKKPLAVLRHTVGGNTSSQVHMGLLAGSVHNVPNATSVWLAHNHPSGNPNPSGREGATGDIPLTVAIDNALKGTGVELAGHIILTSTGKATHITPSGTVEGEGFNIKKPTKKLKKVTVAERRLKGEVENVLGPAINMTEKALEAFENYGKGLDGILLVDAKLSPVDFIPIPISLMQKLRKDGKSGVAADLYRKIEKHNTPARAFIKVKEAGESRAATRNLSSFLAQAGVKTLDVFVGGRSTARNGLIHSYKDDSGIFYSKKNKGKANTHTTKSLKESLSDKLGLRSFARLLRRKNIQIIGSQEKAEDLIKRIKGNDTLYSMAETLGVSREQLQREYKAVEKRYKRTDQWMKAPNGKPTKLNERQWVLVRTPRFKAWFGNWLFDENADIEAVVVPEAEFVPENTDSIKTFFKNNLQGKTVVNRETGQEIGFYRKGLFASLKNKKPVARKLFASLPEVIRAAKLVDYKENRKAKEKPNVAGYERYVAVAEIEGKPYRVELKIDLMKPSVRGQGYYYHQVSELAVSDLVGSTHTQPEQAAVSRSLTTTYKIGDLLADVKPEVSKVVDENGEPLVVYHGTGAKRFNNFNKYSFFTNSKEKAEEYSKQFQPDGSRESNVYEVFLNIKKLEEMEPFTIAEDRLNLFNKKKRVDGTVNPMGWYDSGVFEYVVRNSNQIKSATNNTGAFDGNNPDIRYSKDGKIQGFTHDGKAYLVADGIEKGREWGVLLHELGWHVRKALLKDKSFNRLLASIPQKMKGNTKLARQLREAREKVPKDTPKEHINEETAAYFIEANPETTFARMIIAKVKKLLVDLGIIDVTRLNMNDLVALSVAAVRGGAVSKNNVENPYQDVIRDKHGKYVRRISQKASVVSEEAREGKNRKQETLGQRLKANKANIPVLLSHSGETTPRPVTGEDLKSQEFKEWFGDSLARTDEGVAFHPMEDMEKLNCLD